jgi:hypothetical protein
MFAALRAASPVFDSWVGAQAPSVGAAVPPSVYANAALVGGACTDSVAAGGAIASWIAGANGVAGRQTFAGITGWPPLPLPAQPASPAATCASLQTGAGQEFTYRVLCSTVADLGALRPVCPNGAAAFDSATCTRVFTAVQTYNLTNQAFAIDRRALAWDAAGVPLPPQPQLNAQGAAALQSAAAAAVALLDSQSVALNGACASYQSSAQLWASLPLLLVPTYSVRNWLLFLLQLGSFGLAGAAAFALLATRTAAVKLLARFGITLCPAKHSAGDAAAVAAVAAAAAAADARDTPRAGDVEMAALAADQQRKKPSGAKTVASKTEPATHAERAALVKDGKPAPSDERTVQAPTPAAALEAEPRTSV